MTPEQISNTKDEVSPVSAFFRQLNNDIFLSGFDKKTESTGDDLRCRKTEFMKLEGWSSIELSFEDEFSSRSEDFPAMLCKYSSREIDVKLLAADLDYTID